MIHFENQICKNLDFRLHIPITHWAPLRCPAPEVWRLRGCPERQQSSLSFVRCRSQFCCSLASAIVQSFRRHSQCASSVHGYSQAARMLPCPWSIAQGCPGRHSRLCHSCVVAVSFAVLSRRRRLLLCRQNLHHRPPKMMSVRTRRKYYVW